MFNNYMIEVNILYWTT